jgi:hypothetical protein
MIQEAEHPLPRAYKVALWLLAAAGKVLYVPWAVLLLHVVMAFGAPNVGKSLADLLALAAVLTYPMVQQACSALARARLAEHRARSALWLLAVPVAHGGALLAIFIVRPLIDVLSGA